MAKPRLAYERLPFRLGYDAAAPDVPAQSSAGPDFYDRLGKLLRIVRRNLTTEEWAELGEIVASSSAGSEDARFDEGTQHIVEANGDPLKLLAPRSLRPDGSMNFRGSDDETALTPERMRAPQKPIAAGSVGPKDYWAQDGRRVKTAADREAEQKFDAMFPAAKRIRTEIGYGEQNQPVKPIPMTSRNVEDAAALFDEMFPDAAKIK